jgi:hypothetical protein
MLYAFQLQNKVPKSRIFFFFFVFFFSNENLLFYKANRVEWRTLMRLLERYEDASEQKLNKKKTSIFFSNNTSLEQRH